MSREELPTAQILVVDDETGHAEVMAEALKRMGHVCTVVHDLAGAEEELRHGGFDLVVTDLKMQGEEDGLRVLELARKHQPSAETVMVTAHGDVPTAKKAIRGGAYEFIEKPLDLDVFRTLCARAIETVFLKSSNQELRQRIDEKFGFEGIIGESRAIRELIQRLKMIAPSDIPVLITGESGTGKELVAQALHNHSKRKNGRFVPLNCAGLSESILEDELFGHVRGAYTGADKDRQGRFEYADKGTLFLDEVGDMPAAMQAKLLRVLESGEVVRLGDNGARHVNVRVVSATNHDLKKLSDEGDFRSDLYYRLAGVTLHLPPLRERPEDVPLLVRHYGAQYAKAMDKAAPEVADDAAMMLMQFNWPGNIRQLKSVVQNAVILLDGSKKIEPRHLPPEVREAGGPATAGDAPRTENRGVASMDQLEKNAVRNALAAAQGNREKAAKMLGIGERSLYRKLKEYGLK